MPEAPGLVHEAVAVYKPSADLHSISTAQTGSPSTQTVPAYGVTVVQMHPTSANCRVVHNKNEWPGGLIGTVTVVSNNLGQVNGWDLGFDFPGDIHISHSWSASVSQSGPERQRRERVLQRRRAARRKRPVGLQGHVIQEQRQPIRLLVQRRVLRDRLNPDEAVPRTLRRSGVPPPNVHRKEPTTCQTSLSRATPSPTR